MLQRRARTQPVTVLMAVSSVAAAIRAVGSQLPNPQMAVASKVPVVLDLPFRSSACWFCWPRNFSGSKPGISKAGLICLAFSRASLSSAWALAALGESAC